MPADIHLLLDLTRSELYAASLLENVAQLRSRDSIGGLVSEGTILLPSNVAPEIPKSVHDRWIISANTNPVAVARAACDFAGDCNAHLLVLLRAPSPHAPTDALAMLAEGFELDPHFGVIIPREADQKTGKLLPFVVREETDGQVQQLPRKIRSYIRDYYIIPEAVSGCQLIRNTLLSNLSGLDERYETVTGAVSQYLTEIRRAGFRTIVLNRAVIPASAPQTDHYLLPHATRSDARRLMVRYPDAGRAKEELSQLRFPLQERLLSPFCSSEPRVRHSMLLDLRGVPDYINGTAEAAFGLCDGLLPVARDWNVTLIAEPAAIEHHNLRKRYQDWSVQQDFAGGPRTIAVRPSQPWHFSTMTELHEAALINVYTMLDTISWDILSEAPRGLTQFWGFMTTYADAILYNSHDTRDHVIRRFPDAACRLDHVLHHSFDPNDYVDSSVRDNNYEGDYIFVIGNSYAHKHLIPTVNLLVSSFPFEDIKVLGLTKHANPNVSGLESGRVASGQIEELFARAKAVVFPSFYEGFGFPVLKGLSYGRTVLARDSALLREVAGEYRGPGRLISFSEPTELVESLGRVLHHGSVSTVPLGSNLADTESPRTWRDIASGLLSFLERLLANPELFQADRRDRAISQLQAYCA